jgi:hypothetical protein
VFVRKWYTKTRKSPNVVHRWRCNLDTTLQANTRVFGYNYIYIYLDVKTCFYGPEMALVVNGTQALSAVAETQRSRRISERERQ